jgi:hypothetical protein
MTGANLLSNFLNEIQIPNGFKVNPKIKEAAENPSETLIGIFVHPSAPNTVVLKSIPSNEDEPELSETTFDEYLTEQNFNHQPNGIFLPPMVKSRGVIDITPSEKSFELFVLI